MTINEIAEQYVKLSLKIGQHSQYYVDAYYGPENWRPLSEPTPLIELQQQAKLLISSIANVDVKQTEQRRVQYLTIHLNASLAYINQLQGVTLTFQDECKALYDVSPPIFNETHFDQILKKLNNLVPGKADCDLNERLDRYRQQFVIDIDKLNIVFATAIKETRARTLKYISLPENEDFTVALVNNQVWSAYNWYKGNSYSLIELNTDHPIFIDRVIDLAAHEGYPGHHVFNSLLEKHMVKKNGWMEYSIYTLFSPCSLLSEGSANYGIEVVFQNQDRLKFEKEILFPLAGIDPDKADKYYQIQGVLHELSYVDNMVAQKYLDKEISSEQAIKLLMKYALSNEQRSKQRLNFIALNRAYVINYNYGQDLVKQYLNNKIKSTTPDNLWHAFSQLLSQPKTASMMLSMN